MPPMSRATARQSLSAQAIFALGSTPTALPPPAESDHAGHGWLVGQARCGGTCSIEFRRGHKIPSAHAAALLPGTLQASQAKLPTPLSRSVRVWGLQPMPNASLQVWSGSRSLSCSVTTTYRKRRDTLPWRPCWRFWQRYQVPGSRAPVLRGHARRATSTVTPWAPMQTEESSWSWGLYTTLG